MELDAVERPFGVPHSHDLVLVGPGGDNVLLAMGRINRDAERELAREQIERTATGYPVQ